MFPREDPDPMIKLGLNQPAPTDSAPPAPETLQFRKADVDTAARRCTLCSEAIPGDYYHVAGAVTCPRCAEARQDAQQRRGGPVEFGRAALFGVGAAIAGSVLFAIVSWAIHARFGLLAIVVGVMVGKAVIMGSRGCRGRRYQVLAVLLTYGAITSSYMPEIISGMAKVQARVAIEKKAAGQPVVVRDNRNVTPIQIAVGLVAIFVLSLIAPFLLLTHGTGFVGMIIIGIGLLQAWRLTAADEAAIMGPYAA
jgi:hypothetical protein